MNDKDLLKTVKQFRKGILGRKGPEGRCYMVTWPLQTFLKAVGCMSEVIEVVVVLTGVIHSHYCLRLEDGRILDPTASQFKTPFGENMPDIYLGQRPHWYQKLRGKRKTNNRQLK